VWSPVWGGLDNGSASALIVYDDGNGAALYAGGNAAGTWHGIARYDGSTWQSLGNGVNGPVWALAAFDDGHTGGPDLFVSGTYSQYADGVPALGYVRWLGCHRAIDPMCFGDGSLVHCPCGNRGIGKHGCENSASTGGARLYASGAVPSSALQLTSTAELPTSLTIFLQGDALNPFALPFGDGIRCVGGNLKRLFTKNALNGTAQAPQTGDPSIPAKSTSLGDSISAGSGLIRYYQAYYRDGVAGFCDPPAGSSFNASNELRIVW